MESDAEIIIAFIFKRSGKQKLKLSEFYLPLSMQLNWFSPREAKDFAKTAIKQKLLKEKEGIVYPAFGINQIKIPVGFHPTKQVFKIKEKPDEKTKASLPEQIVEAISQKIDSDKKTIVEKINQIEQEKNVTFELAALLFGKECGIVLEDFYEKIRENIEE